MKILVIVAHPDDEAVWAGATLATLARAGHEITCVCCSDEAAHAPAGDTRRREYPTSCAVLGIEGTVLDVPLSRIRESFGHMEIEGWPLILTHGPDGDRWCHEEHRWVRKEVLAHLASVSWRGLLLSFASGHTADIVVRCDPLSTEARRAALLCHASQAGAFAGEFATRSPLAEGFHFEPIPGGKT